MLLWMSKITWKAMPEKVNNSYICLLEYLFRSIPDMIYNGICRN